MENYIVDIAWSSCERFAGPRIHISNIHLCDALTGQTSHVVYIYNGKLDDTACSRVLGCLNLSMIQRWQYWLVI